MMRTHLHIVIAALLAFAALSCKEHVADNASANRQPRTFLWLYPDTEIRTVVSRESLHWWGEDPDGVVRGYLFAFRKVETPASGIPSPDTQRYTWTTATDTTLLFPLDTLFQRFAVSVRAVDDAFPGLPEHSIVRLQPFAYWDRNDDGVFNSGDELLSSLAGSADPVGVTLTFPIRNSPPVISYAASPLDPTIPLKVPDTTFTVATFAWTGSDPDGNNTLKDYRIALNDSSAQAGWLTVSLRDTVVTLVVPRNRSDAAGAAPGTIVTADVYGGAFLGRRLIGQINGLRLNAVNTLYAEARDVAGEYSAPVTFPAANGTWFVKRPVSRLLLVSDYVNSDAQAALSTYLTGMQNIPEFPAVDLLNIGLGVTLADKNAGKVGTLVPPFVDPALIQTFLLFDYVLWYTDQQPSLGVAQLSIFPYLQNGGKVLFSTTFVNTIDPRGALRDFAPIDSISTVTLPATSLPAAGDTRIPANYVLFADSSVPGNIYPQLALNSTPANHVIFMRPVYRRTDARYLYHLQPDSARGRYLGMPNVAVVDGQRQIIFFGLPLHLLDNKVVGNPMGLQAFFDKVFNQEFNPTLRVNRMRF